VTYVTGGLTGPSGSLSMSHEKITNLLSGAAVTDAANFGQTTYTSLADPQWNGMPRSDWTAAAAAAIASFPSTGGTLYIPPGTYLFGNSGTEPGIVVPSSSVIVGAGRGATTIQMSGLFNAIQSAMYGIHAAEDTFVAVRDLTITWPTSGGSFLATRATGPFAGTTLPVVSTSGFPTAGYIWVADVLVQYTGTTSTSFTGCTVSHGSLPTVQVHAEVKLLNSQGHGIALQGGRMIVHNVSVGSAPGSNIFIQSGGPNTTSPDHDIHIGRLTGPLLGCRGGPVPVQAAVKAGRGPPQGAALTAAAGAHSPCDNGYGRAPSAGLDASRNVLVTVAIVSPARS
jgi:hypothetical protein